MSTLILKMDFTFLSSSAFLYSTVAAALLVYFGISRFRRRKELAQLSAQHGCQTITLAHNKLPFALDRMFKLVTHKGNVLDDLMFTRFVELGSWMYRDDTSGPSPILCAEPEAIKAILSTNFKDWGVGKLRHAAVGPWLGHGIFVSDHDGPMWLEARKLLRPNFARDEIYNLAVAERHVQELFKVVPSGPDGWTSGKDLSPMIRRFTFDVVTEVFCAGSVDSQRKASQPRSAQETLDINEIEYAFDNANKTAALRIMSGGFYWLFNPESFRVACATFSRFAYSVVDEAMATRKSYHPDEGGEYSFVRSLAATTDNRKLIRDIIVQMLFAGIDTSVSLLSFSLLSLAREPGAWQRLRDELDREGLLQCDPETITSAKLKSCSYLQHVLLESLRLYPSIPINTRDAVRDTVLPVGGGPDRKSPVLVEKGTQVKFSCYIMQRREDIWGPDVLEWKPDRWVGRQQGWEFLPFNGGPRVCIGRKWNPSYSFRN